MAIRNFWLEARIDNRKTDLTGGPRGKDGGFTLNIYMRDKGKITRPFTIYGGVTREGKLVLEISNNEEVYFTHETEY